MQLPNEEPPLCGFCRKRPGAERYPDSDSDKWVCTACLEQWAIDDDVARDLYGILLLEHHRRYDEALAGLDPILEKYRHRDQTGWVANSVALTRTSILFEAGRYVEAEQAYSEWARIGFNDLWRQRMYALGLAKTLEALGRDQEAVAVLEDVLVHEDPNDLPMALTVLGELVHFLDKLDLPVDTTWLKFAEGVAEHYGVEMPSRDSLHEAIVALNETARAMESKRAAERAAAWRKANPEPERAS